MSIALVGNVGAASNNSNTITTGSLDTTGATLLVAVSSLFNNTENISDSKSNTWTGRTVQTCVSSLLRCRIMYVTNPTVGSGHTFTSTCTAGYPVILVLAFSGTDTSSPYDKETGNSDLTGPNSFPCGSMTPTNDGEVIVAGITNVTASTLSIDYGYTIPATQGQFNWTSGQCDTAAIAYVIQTSKTLVNPSFSNTNISNSNSTVQAAFKAAAGGGGTPIRRNSNLNGIGAAGSFFQDPLGMKSFKKNRNHIYIPSAPKATGSSLYLP